MNVGEEVRAVTIARTLSFSAPELAQAAALDHPDEWSFADGGPDATATLVRHE